VGASRSLRRCRARFGRVQPERQSDRGKSVACWSSAEPIVDSNRYWLTVAVDFSIATAVSVAGSSRYLSADLRTDRSERCGYAKAGSHDSAWDSEACDAAAHHASTGDAGSHCAAGASNYPAGDTSPDSGADSGSNEPAATSFPATAHASSVPSFADAAAARAAMSGSTGAMTAQRTHLLVQDGVSDGADRWNERVALGVRLAAAVPVILLGNTIPNIGLLFVVTLGVFCFGYGALVAIIRAQSRTDDDREWAERFTLTADVSLVAFALLVFAPDPGWAVYASGFLVIASGGFRFRNGALLAAASLSLAYIVVAIFRTTGLAMPLAPAQLALHLGSYLLAGVLMNAVLPQLDALRSREADVYEPILRAQQDNGEALVMTDDGRPVHWNRAFEELSGLGSAELERSSSLSDVLGVDSDALVAVHDAAAPQRAWLRARDGRAVAVEISRQVVDVSDGQRMVWIIRDVTAREKSEAELRQHALHDALTGLPNRTLLADRLSSAIAVAQRHFGPVSVLLLDLDGFKQVNDVLGHESGDRVLVEVANRITGALRDSDTAARLGGDEFVVLLPSTGLSGAVATARALNQVIADPIAFAEGARTVSASIGIAVFPDDGRDPTTLLAAADAAMYEAKRTGCGWCRQAQAAGQ
jgi:diguanylate cyclase (GGDEF)-like protein/PAS domain S-box-containing protein